MAPLTFFKHFATRWCHLHWLKILPPGGVIRISFKLGHRMAPLALIVDLATRLHNLHCQNTLLPFTWIFPNWPHLTCSYLEVTRILVMIPLDKLELTWKELIGLIYISAKKAQDRFSKKVFCHNFVYWACWEEIFASRSTGCPAWGFGQSR